MHKKVKNVLAKTLALTLAVSMMNVSAPAAEAAKKPALSAKKVTLKTGKTKKVKIKNVKAKKVKKLTVSVDKKKVASVKKNGKTAFTIKGKKAGKAKVTVKVKVGKKTTKLTVKVSVKKVSDGTVTPAPVTEAPATGAPSSNAPVSPSASAPATGAPTTGAPATGAPATGVPATGAPATGAPASNAPATPGASTAPTSVPKTYPYTVVENDFDTDLGGWFARFNEDDNKAAGLDTKVSISEEAHTGSGAMLISERLKTWNSPGINLTDILTQGGQYKVSFWAKVPDADDDFDYGIDLVISGAITTEEGDGEWYTNYPSDTKYPIKYGEWTKCETTFTAPAAFYNFVFYVETSSSGKASFLIDDLKIECLSEPAEYDDTLPSIKETYKDYFPIMGTAIGYDTLLNKNSLGFTKKHYDSVTYGNSMKPDAVMGSQKTLVIDTGSIEIPEDGKIETASIEDYYITDDYASHKANLDADGNVIVPEINFANIDKELKIAHDNGFKVRFHTFIWHQQMPRHFFTVGYSTDSKAEYVDQATMFSREEMYIKSIMNHIFAKNYPYRDTVYTIDVVNEYTHMDNLSKQEGSDNWWKYMFGEVMKTDCEYVKRAFKYAYEALEANEKTDDVSLMYNDYNTYDFPDTIVELINNINKKDDINPKGQKICAGIGMQAHLNDGGATPERFNNAVDKFREAGFEIQVTELDITNCGTVDENTTPEDKAEVEADGAKMWGDIMTILLNQKAKGANITAVVIWGSTDSTSWRSTKSPLLFGKDLADKKPAFDAVINAAKNFKPEE